MKKILSILAIIAITIIIENPLTSFANDNKTKQDHVCGTNCKATSTTDQTSTTDLKDHVCTSACKDGKCVYAHGEKGHVCTDTCKSTMTNKTKTDLKAHVCTTACKNGKCVFLHGEKGHVCTEACKKK